METENGFFNNTMKDIKHISPVLEGVTQHALELGAPPEGLNLYNAWSKCDKAIRELHSYEQNAEGMGYTSLAHALKALSQYKDTHTFDISQLPTVFHKVPKLWRVGRANTRKTQGFAPLTLRAAIREHKQIIPLLLEAWDLADEVGRDNLVKEYLKSSAESFKDQLYEFINENEDTPLEEQFLDEISKQVERERFEDWQGKSKHRKI